MTRLDKLKIEGRIASKLTLLPIQVRKVIAQFYKRESEEIELYGAENSLVDEESIKDLRDIILAEGVEKDGN